MKNTSEPNALTRIMMTKVYRAENKKAIVGLREVGRSARWLRKNRKNYESNN